MEPNGYKTAQGELYGAVAYENSVIYSGPLQLQEHDDSWNCVVPLGAAKRMQLLENAVLVLILEDARTGKMCRTQVPRSDAGETFTGQGPLKHPWK